MLHFLTDPRLACLSAYFDMLSMPALLRVTSFTLLATNWTVYSLLDQIAQSTQPRYHALIDTGALITGLSNYEVAVYLLQHGLQGMAGVVFLDSLDRKMILVRANMKVAALSCDVCC